MAVAAKLCRLASSGTRNPRQPISSPSTVAQSRMTVIVAVKTKYKAIYRTSDPRVPSNPGRPRITAINSPEDGFFEKEINYRGIPIKASSEVAGDALYILYDRLALQTAHLP